MHNSCQDPRHKIAISGTTISITEMHDLCLFICDCGVMGTNERCERRTSTQIGLNVSAWLVRLGLGWTGQALESHIWLTSTYSLICQVCLCAACALLLASASAALGKESASWPLLALLALASNPATVGVRDCSSTGGALLNSWSLTFSCSWPRSWALTASNADSSLSRFSMALCRPCIQGQPTAKLCGRRSTTTLQHSQDLGQGY